MRIPENLTTNRSFLYGDGFFETFLIENGKCQRFTLHYERIKKSFMVLQMEFNQEWTQLFFEELLNNESRLYKERILKVRIIFYRNSPGTYSPDNDKSGFYLKLEPYIPNIKKVLSAGIYPLAKKPCNFLSSIKSTSCLMFVMAAKYAKEMGWDEIIILNEYGRVCEGLTSNIFIKKKDIFYTPPISEGCIDGVNRKAFIKENTNMGIIERPIEVHELNEGKLYFSNAVIGMVLGELDLISLNNFNENN